ncbi:MAG: hypothetical protein LAN84_09795 [Acidobacteriia bacterium]|nr:hypothetical protein [Terriglobia bacterium]
MSKLANPWKCDNPACGILRANDTNHWLIVAYLPAAPPTDIYARVSIQPWNDFCAEMFNAKHACGIDCGLKIAAQLIVENFYPHDLPAPSTGKEGSRGD